jgi:pimeloyl-ACP methyl ester carboxylesterase
MKVLVLLGLVCVINGTCATIKKKWKKCQRKLISAASPLGEHERWNMIPDEEGKLHVIDLNPVEDVVEPAFNPETDTRFVLFTRSNPNSGQVLTTNADNIRNSNFNSAWPVRLLIHGWNSGLSSGVNTRPTESYLQLGNFNVIQIDWSIGAGTANYITARNRVPNVAVVVANFLNFLVNQGFISSMERVSIGGHSLGAHIAGLTGKRTQDSGRRIHTIWGMDPAGPLFKCV